MHFNIYRDGLIVLQPLTVKDNKKPRVHTCAYQAGAIESPTAEPCRLLWQGIKRVESRFKCFNARSFSPELWEKSWSQSMFIIHISTNRLFSRRPSTQHRLSTSKWIFIKDWVSICYWIKRDEGCSPSCLTSVCSGVLIWGVLAQQASSCFLRTPHVIVGNCKSSFCLQTKLGMGVAVRLQQRGCAEGKGWREPTHAYCTRRSMIKEQGSSSWLTVCTLRSVHENVFKLFKNNE